jgi:hypothetical protein
MEAIGQIHAPADITPRPVLDRTPVVPIPTELSRLPLTTVKGKVVPLVLLLSATP